MRPHPCQVTGAGHYVRTMRRTSCLTVAGREFRATVVLAGPLVGGQLCLIAANVVDEMLAGHLGADVLGAVAVGTSIWSFASGFWANSLCSWAWRGLANGRYRLPTLALHKIGRISASGTS